MKSFYLIMALCATYFVITAQTITTINSGYAGATTNDENNLYKLNKSNGLVSVSKINPTTLASVILDTFRVSSAFNANNFAVKGDKFIYIAYSQLTTPNKYTIYAYDGTKLDTIAKDTLPQYQATVVNEKNIIFKGNTAYIATATNVYKTDFTAGGTQAIYNFPQQDISKPGVLQIRAAGNELYIHTAEKNNGYRSLYRYDGINTVFIDSGFSALSNIIDNVNGNFYATSLVGVTGGWRTKIIKCNGTGCNNVFDETVPVIATNFQDVPAELLGFAGGKLIAVNLAGGLFAMDLNTYTKSVIADSSGIGYPFNRYPSYTVLENSNVQGKNVVYLNTGGPSLKNIRVTNGTTSIPMNTAHRLGKSNISIGLSHTCDDDLFAIAIDNIYAINEVLKLTSTGAVVLFDSTTYASNLVSRIYKVANKTVWFDNHYVSPTNFRQNYNSITGCSGPTSISPEKNLNTSKLSLYPNPSVGLITIENTQIGSTLVIRNNLGEIVFTTKCTSNKIKCETYNWPAGVYSVINGSRYARLLVL